ncbi:Laccase domain protein YfiH [Legionella massiliensis]|uniref:Purine nucleoside phosphorylase n=1 Tax=Legionella massiliensis TaxID=1034943 RepID=A0A078L196_9GAMM|nr:peptidoglycan editing factor PgeF [Legionella massiliensis]CDZ78946.1 Laccase domain protein YfiH [Legionella massiliensis]CEE14684.1 Laccase domain protein YfiH [Legionella massiliensis]
MIEIIKDKDFASLKSIGHAFFTRQGGVSKPPYNSLNCNDSGRDKPESVQENKRRALEHLNLHIESMITVRMVHGHEVAVVDKSWDVNFRPEADAMVTTLKNVVLASNSADCPIVLLADEGAEVIGLAHAGWRSAKSGIIEKTVEKMITLGAKQNQIAAVIGPCITKDSYEVDSIFFQQFLLAKAQNKVYFSPSKKPDHYMFDLLSYVNDDLNRLVLKSVTAIGLDTYKKEELFFSCRRAYHRNEPDFGGHLSCVYFV